MSNGEKIEKTNELIAEFMELEIWGPGFFAGYVYKENLYHFDQLKFHSSWDWLMAVVDKVENLGYFTLITESRIQISFNDKNKFQRNIVNLWQGEASNSYKTKMQGLYKAVIKFIKWYNDERDK